MVPEASAFFECRHAHILHMRNFWRSRESRYGVFETNLKSCTIPNSGHLIILSVRSRCRDKETGSEGGRGIWPTALNSPLNGEGGRQVPFRVSRIVMGENKKRGALLILGIPGILEVGELFHVSF